MPGNETQINLDDAVRLLSRYETELAQMTARFRELDGRLNTLLNLMQQLAVAQSFFTPTNTPPFAAPSTEARTQGQWQDVLLRFLGTANQAD